MPIPRADGPGKPVAARGLVSGRGPRRQAWEGWSVAEGLPGIRPGGTPPRWKPRRKPVAAARGLVSGRGPRRLAWEGWSEAEGLPGFRPGGKTCPERLAPERGCALMDDGLSVRAFVFAFY